MDEWTNKQKYLKKINSTKELDNAFRSTNNFIFWTFWISILLKANKNIILDGLKFITVYTRV